MYIMFPSRITFTSKAHPQIPKMHLASHPTRFPNATILFPQVKDGKEGLVRKVCFRIDFDQNVCKIKSG